MNKILIIDEMHPSIVPMLQNIGFEVDYLPHITDSQVLECVEKYTGIVLRSKIFIDKTILEKAVNLKFIARAGAGMDQIVEEEVKKRKIALLNAPEGNRDAVAEHVIGMILCMYNNILRADSEVRSGIWHREQNRGIELGDKTVAIIGYGNTGKTLSRKLSGFACRVLAYDKYKHFVKNQFATFATLDHIKAEADVVSLHIPLTQDTDGWINYAFLSSFAKPIYVINTSRGGVLVIKDLLQAIDDGKVLGAALDVLETENLEKFKKNDPYTYDRLMTNNKILLTPHIAGWTNESYIKINQVLIHKIKKLKI
ncbi:MAG: NAD(P)-dependent oxidoreductase [Cytophagales bacterium]|nr:NAD(P)-dependent oxidoreductase [Cytophagales bacterium]